MGKPRSNQNRQAKHSGRRTEVDEDAILEFESNRPVFGFLSPRGPRQAQLIHALEEKRMIFVTGPAGTGKTFVSTSWAVEQLMAKEIERIIIARPMVGCEEEVGFLPGTEQEKTDPWLGPFFDVMEGKLGKGRVESLKKFGKIVARPIMMMRGLTFRNAIVILDEAQNTTAGQMKMFLTRLGQGSKVVICGDLEQTDLPPGVTNGLEDAVRLFSDVRSAGFVNFLEEDITRDPLVRDIVQAYRKGR